jgi:hypothetical protein
MPSSLDTRRASSQHIPHLEVEDKLITLGPLVLTLRQTGILMLGGCVIFDLWKQCQGWLVWGTTGQVLRITLVVLLSLLCLACAYGRIAGRTYEAWLLVLWRYGWQTKLALWRSLPRAIPQHAPTTGLSGALVLLCESEARS